MLTAQPFLTDQPAPHEVLADLGDVRLTGTVTGVVGAIARAALQQALVVCGTTRIGGSSLKYAGCQATATFPTAGQWKVTLTGVDSASAKGTATVSVNVIDPPPHSPPSVHITQPAENAILNGHAYTTLTGTAIDPDGTGSITYKWTVTKGTEETQIGTTQSLQWKPAPDVGTNCGGFPVKLNPIRHRSRRHDVGLGHQTPAQLPRLLTSAHDFRPGPRGPAVSPSA